MQNFEMSSKIVVSGEGIFLPRIIYEAVYLIPQPCVECPVWWADGCVL